MHPFFINISCFYRYLSLFAPIPPLFLSRRNKGNIKGTQISQITQIFSTQFLKMMKFIFYLRHSKNSFSRCFRQNINLYSKNKAVMAMTVIFKNYYLLYLRDIMKNYSNYSNSFQK